MATLFDYIKWRGDLSFTEAPFNEVDSLIFSLLTYLDMKGIVPDAHNGATVPIKAAANAFFSQNPDPKKISLGLIVPKEIIKLFRAVKSLDEVFHVVSVDRTVIVKAQVIEH